MHCIAFVMACMAFTTPGRRLQASLEQLKGFPSAESQEPQEMILRVIDDSNRRASTKDELNQLEAFARILLTVDPRAALVPSSYLRRPMSNRKGTSHSQHVDALNRWNRLDHKFPVMQATTEDLKLLKVPELKAKLKALGQKVSGNKADLIARLQEHGAEQTESDHTEAEAALPVIKVPKVKRPATSEQQESQREELQPVEAEAAVPATSAPATSKNAGLCATEPGPHVKHIVIVENMEGQEAVCSACGPTVLVTTIVGGRLKQRLAEFKEFADKSPNADTIIWTDHHGPGVRLRLKIASKLKGAKHAFIPQDVSTAIDGEPERRRASGRLSKDVVKDEDKEYARVEDSSPEAIRASLAKARFAQYGRDKYTIRDLQEWGLLAECEKWMSIPPITTHGRLVGEFLGLGICSGKQLEQGLNLFFTDEELQSAIDALPADEPKSIWTPKRADSYYGQDEAMFVPVAPEKKRQAKEDTSLSLDQPPPRPDDPEKQILWDALFGGTEATEDSAEVAEDSNKQGTAHVEERKPKKREDGYEAEFSDRSEAPPRPSDGSELSSYWDALYGDLD